MFRRIGRLQTKASATSAMTSSRSSPYHTFWISAHMSANPGRYPNGSMPLHRSVPRMSLGMNSLAASTQKSKPYSHTVSSNSKCSR